MSMIAEARGPAEIYDESFVPALFAQWGPVVAKAAGVREGNRVLDVACGTGALTRAVAERVGTGGSAVGLDINPEMLAVARRRAPHIEWLDGSAEKLPCPDGDFDAVVSQFGFMFFEDRPRALREMMRVLRPGGRMAVAVCDDVENSPGYAAFAKLLDRLFGASVGDAFRAPFTLGDRDMLMADAREAGIRDADVSRHHGAVRFASVSDLVSTERACVWTLGGVLDDEQFDRLLAESGTALRPFVRGDGTIEFDMPALILSARKQAG